MEKDDELWRKRLCEDQAIPSQFLWVKWISKARILLRSKVVVALVVGYMPSELL